MTSQHAKQVLPMLITGPQGRSVWSTCDWPTESRGGMLLSPRFDCSSLRLRQSAAGYRSDWHVAGDATLIIIRRGTLRLILRDDSTRDFGPGDAFIAGDRLREGEAFDDTLHGHRAEVVGDTMLEAVHIKLVGVGC